MKRLGDVCDIVGGGTPSKSVASYYAGDISWATVRDMRSDWLKETECKISKKAIKESATNVIPKGNVVIATRVGLGKVCLLEKDTAINQDLKGVLPKNTNVINRLFLFHWLKSVSDVIIGHGTGATVQGVKIPFIAGLNIPIPPLPVQKHIVAVLEEAFDAIAKAKENAENNLANARELFKSHLQSIFSEAWETCELVKLSELAIDITDGDHMPPPKSASGVPFITIGNINKKTRRVNFSDTFKVSEAYFNNLKTNRKPKRGDVLYTVTGSFGIPVLVEDDVEFCFQRHIGLLRPKPTTNSKWLNYLLLSPQVFRQAYDRATGTAQKTVSLKVLRSIIVPSVLMPQQRFAVAKLDALSNETKRLESIYQEKLANLEELKKSILRKAFSGELAGVNS